MGKYLRNLFFTCSRYSMFLKQKIQANTRTDVLKLNILYYVSQIYPGFNLPLIVYKLFYKKINL